MLNFFAKNKLLKLGCSNKTPKLMALELSAQTPPFEGWQRCLNVSTCENLK